jgi:membrane protease YdiL (CAAX protease family)
MGDVAAALTRKPCHGISGRGDDLGNRGPRGQAVSGTGCPARRAVSAAGCFAQTVGLLVLFSVARGFALLGPPAVSAGLLTAALIVVAWAAGASPDDLGAGRAHVRAGVRYGAAAFLAVLLVLLAAAAVPAERGFLHDARAQVSGGRLAYEAVVSILLLTAIPEELAFRGVLLWSGARLWGKRRASFASSALFGLWHVQPTLHTLARNQALGDFSASAVGEALLELAAVTATFAAGLVFCWLRLRSKSLVAPVMAHAATNGLALVAAWFTLH